jgi:AcrR family transcriptional regulator
VGASERSERRAALNGKKLVRRELVEAELLERAADLFAERGFSGTTLQDVADTVGLTRAALYHYFDSKEALLTTLVEGITAARVADLKAIRLDGALTLRDQLAAITRAMALNVATHAARFRLLLMSENELPAELAATHARARRETLKQLVEFFEEGRASGAFTAPDPRLAAFALLGMCNWIAMWFKPDQQQSAEAVAEHYVQIALTAFAGNAAAANDVPATIGRMREDLARLERLTRST